MKSVNMDEITIIIIIIIIIHSFYHYPQNNRRRNTIFKYSNKIISHLRIHNVLVGTSTKSPTQVLLLFVQLFISLIRLFT